jgi:mannosyltransferase
MLVETPRSLRLEDPIGVRFDLSNFVFYIVGVFLMLIAVFVSNGWYTQALTGNSRELSWGPALFRSLLLFHGILLLAIGFVSRPLSRWKNAAEDITGDTHEKEIFIAMIALAAVALVLRIWQLNSGLWIDEVLTLVDFVRHPLGEIVTTFPSQNQHMLYSVLARISFDIFGDSIWALRIPSVLFGIGSIWALFYLGKTILGSKEALLASILMTFSYHHIWFSQNARGYTGLLLATLIATWAWLKALRNPRLKWWVIYGISIVAGMMLHMTMAFVVATHVIVFIIFALVPKLSNDGQPGVNVERRSGWAPFVVWALSATATLQLYALALPEFLAVGIHEESKNSEWTNPIWVIKESLANLTIGFAGISIVVLGIAFVIFGWTRILYRDRRVALIIALPAAISGATMILLGHNLFPRFFFFSMGFGLLVVIHGAIELPKFLAGLVASKKFDSSLLNRAGLALASVMIVASAVTIPRNYELPKQDFAGAKTFVQSQPKGNEEVVAVGLAGDMYAKYFAPEWRVTNDPDELKQFQIAGASWLVYTLSPELKSFHPELWATIQENYQTVRSFPGTLNGGDVVVCRYKSKMSENHE